jgi:hypothetical protein
VFDSNKIEGEMITIVVLKYLVHLKLIVIWFANGSYIIIDGGDITPW